MTNSLREFMGNRSLLFLLAYLVGALSSSVYQSAFATGWADWLACAILSLAVTIAGVRAFDRLWCRWYGGLGE